MMLASNVVKIKYSDAGYLPNYPPHLISDEEMCQAFLTNEISYFYDTYMLVEPGLIREYNKLLNAFRFHIARYLSKIEAWQQDLPSWVWSYMLGEVVHQESVQQDKHYLLTGLGCDNIDDDITPESQILCYKRSYDWVAKLSKNLKILNVKSEIDKIFKNLPDELFYKYVEIIFSELKRWGVKNTETWTIEDYRKPGLMDTSKYDINIRPPAMFGEPHVIKLIRLSEADNIIRISEMDN